MPSDAGSVPVPPPSEGVSRETPPAKKYVSPLDFLERTYQDDRVDMALRIRAATAAAGFVHIKKTDEGKKAERAEKAKETGSVGSRFTPGARPVLKAA